MSEHKKSKIRVNRGSEDAEDVAAVLEVVSKEIPSLIKGIINSVFSEEAGKEMGKAAGAFYKELKESGMPNEIAVKMTEDYISTFTNIGKLMTKLGNAGSIGEKIEEKLKEKSEESQAEE